MSTGTPGSISAPYIPTSTKFPLDPEQLQQTQTKRDIEIAQAVNKRTIGSYYEAQIVTGNLYYSLTNNNIENPIQFRQSYRQIYVFGAIAAGATLLIAHGITGITEIVNLYGNCITDGSVVALATAKYEPIPFVSTANVNQQVSLYMDDTNITIINGAGNNNILSGSIITEYLLN